MEKSLERVEYIVIHSRVSTYSMANCRAEYFEIAGVEGVPRRADYLIYHRVAVF